MKRKEEVLLPYNYKYIMNIVDDIEKYPHFLPHCDNVEVLDDSFENGAHIRRANMTISYYGFNQVIECLVKTYETKIEVEYIKGPFRKMHNLWIFHPQKSNNTMLKFYIEYEVENILLGAIVKRLDNYLYKKMVSIFIKRARQLQN